jgi:hypothetical protein
MILVRTEFHCKFGRVQEAIDSFKAMAEDIDTQNVIKRTRIMTDLSGRFDTVIVESEVVGIIANHILTDAAWAFEVDASNGLFTDNITDRPNDVQPSSIEQPPNILI